MKIQEFLRHHKIDKNPFAEEDAQTDPVFKDHCIFDTYHPTWDKVFGNPADPSTSIVFGEKGAGKTALRLQVERHLRDHNRENPKGRCFVINYDDFNPFLDEFCQRLGRKGRKPAKALVEYQLWDHMDSILSLGTTQLIDEVLSSRRKNREGEESTLLIKQLRKLDHHQRRDLMLLASCYDRPTSAPHWERWKKLRRRLRFGTWKSWMPFWLGLLVTVAVVAAGAYYCYAQGHMDGVLNMVGWAEAPAEPIAEEAAEARGLPRFVWWTGLGVVVLGWVPWMWRRIHRLLVARGTIVKMRVLPNRTIQLGRCLSRFTTAQLSRQPLPNHDRTDDRYSLLRKFQSILKTLGYRGIVVLVDRVDEPNLINGSADLMRAFLWPMLDNKFLKQPGLGIKFMLPAELTKFIDREDREFYERARLDKQNLIPSLAWTGEALYDLANARLSACTRNEASPRLRDLLDESIDENRLYEVLRSLRVPRHMFRFLHRMIVAHCNKHSDDDPAWKVAGDTFETELALYTRSMNAANRGLGAG